MPNLSPQRLQSLVADPKLAQVLRAQDQHNSATATAVNNALVRGDTLQILTPYTATKPLAVPADWVALTNFTTGWSAAGSNVTQYKGDALGGVHLQFGFKGPNDTDNVFATALPSTVRPGQQLNIAATLSNGTEQFGRVLISTAGQIQVRDVVPSTSCIGYVYYAAAVPAPYVPSCFPFSVAWQKNYAPSLVIAECSDVTTPNAPTNLAACLPDWTTSTSSGGTLINVRNIPGLLPSVSYSVTLLVL